MSQKVQRNFWPKVLGAGPGSSKYFTTILLSSLKDAETVVASSRILQEIKKISATDAELIELPKGGELYEFLNTIKSKERTYVLSTGDPMVSGLGKFFPESEIEPGISSIQKCASLIHKPINDSAIISSRYKNNYGKISHLIALGLNVYLLPEPELTVSEVVKKIASNVGYKLRLHICIDVSLDTERVYVGSVEDFMNLDDNGLKVIFVEPSPS
ncbi:SAM-dependent methyltransferase [Metallosphaera tengchongensis]|uniref:SAM-dependent methyltransferase n=1 Tax=Metallosphaera tengchongensis TaxID=1532350 RepID=UPI001FE2AF64|nr:SAM-dependent methyltransferase [Metallosphaera tengchongensis]